MTRARLLLAAAVVATALLPGGAAYASAPDAYGYWSKTAPVPPPGVPDGGVYVALGPYTPDPAALPDPNSPPPPTEPAAIAALRFVVPEGASATLTLKVADGQSATNPDGTPVAIDACQPDIAAGAWQPPAANPGDFAQRPKYSCSAVSVASTVDAAAGTVTWSLPGSFQVTTGVLDVVLVPTGTAPFQVAFAQPDSSTLAASDAPAPEPETEPSPVPETPAGDFGSELAVDAPVTDFGGSTAPVALPTTPTSAPRQVALDTPGRGQARARPVAVVDDRGDRIFAVAVLFVLAAALWWVGGQPVNAPRLLGSLGDRRGAGPSETAGSAPAVPVGGVGRFARPRPTRPSRL